MARRTTAGATDGAAVDEALELIKRGTAELIGEDQLRKALGEGRPLRVKAGFDPTSADLHLGHTVVMEKLRHFQTLGHTVVFLIGDFTAAIGDPSGQSKLRPRLAQEEISAHARTYSEQAFKILDREKTEVVFNSTWMSKLSAADLMGLAAQQTVARMSERDDFEKRLKAGDPVGIHEFLYPLVQGYDSVMVRADVEVGGTDQKFNLLVGRDLQRNHGMPAQAVITMPLLEGLDGRQKMSKSLGNAVGITESAQEMYGKLMSISDQLMLRYYELLSEADVDRIESVKSGDLHPMEAKKGLAFEIAERYHGVEAARGAASDFELRFQKGGLPDDIPEFHWPGEAGGQDPEVWVCRLMKDSGLVASTAQARRLIKQGGVRIGGERLGDDSLQVATRGSVLIQVGKRRVVKVLFDS
ncbi:MAG: tyrosine--tRNA ligase [Deltaproteobacteria bacterium]